MSFLIPFFGVIFGFIAAIAIIFFIIYWKIKSTVGKANMIQLTSAMKNATNLKREEYSREKSIKGMTSLLEPEIIRDFPDFNKDLLFSVCENNMRKIFNSIESKNDSEIMNDKNFTYLKKQLKEQIEDMKSNNIFEKFDNIEFNRHAICSYMKKSGKATIKVSSTLSYYYNTNRKDKQCFSDIKKQTRYTSEFVYVYDESKFTEDQVSFSVGCPNCGAPLVNLQTSYCKYCGTFIEKINLKLWKMSSCKEDYK